MQATLTYAEELQELAAAGNDTAEASAEAIAFYRTITPLVDKVSEQDAATIAAALAAPVAGVEAKVCGGQAPYPFGVWVPLQNPWAVSPSPPSPSEVQRTLSNALSLWVLNDLVLPGTQAAALRTPSQGSPPGAPRDTLAFLHV